MKRSVRIAGAMLALSVLFLSAQISGQAPQKLQAVAAELKLTPAQEMKLMPILKAEAPKVEAIKADSSLSPMQKMQQLKAVHAETDPQVKSILTPEQYQTLQTIRRREVEQAIRKRMGQ
jgi:hypothetical protein